ncbi:zinc finger protein 717-like isoform X2 [Thrips palmi]|uniref:Zinc finger protein 717-like isoform X2 n=1 Tax=Thrips palmi TaxID=161013 RepID=A0A6P8YDF8_THRPL|nr:zinc finger protein 717-like isoform X2 [Thrips palmi]XP_034234910.1 zinc finger protein 717-like isoform X2 [Thrips palmi]
MSHVMARPEETSFRCTVCNSYFSRRSSLLTHLEIGEMQSECTVCDRTSNSRSALATDFSTHSAIASVCSVCNKEIGNEQNLKTHLETCNRSKLFHFKDCEMAFSTGRGLANHRKFHTEDKLSECTICNKKFGKAYLATHLRTHTHTGKKPYKCSICSRAFSLKSGLGVHLATHQKNKPFECTVCNKKLLGRFSLIVHLRTHTGVMPYAQSARGASDNVLILLRTSEFIQGRGPTGARVATRSLVINGMSRFMKEFTRVKGPTSAQFATRNLISILILQGTLGSIEGKSPLNVWFATRSFVR